MKMRTSCAHDNLPTSDGKVLESFPPCWCLLDLEKVPNEKVDMCPPTVRSVLLCANLSLSSSSSCSLSWLALNVSRMCFSPRDL